MLDIIIALCTLICLLCLTQIALTRRTVSRERSKGYDRSTPKLIPSTQTRSLLEKLHKIEYDLLAEGTHDAFRNDPNAQIPDVVYEELDYMDARGCTLIIQSINYIRQHINSEPLEVMADFDAMLCRIIQRHEDEFNYPPTNFRC
jgi:uncharacterized membrane protein